jgi:hypothetical protein
MHRQGRTAMKFSIHSKTPRIRERQIFVEAQQSQPKQWAHFNCSGLRSRRLPNALLAAN